MAYLIKQHTGFTFLTVYIKIGLEYTHIHKKTVEQRVNNAIDTKNDFVSSENKASVLY